MAAESIQRMLANLPAKRAVRQIFPNLTEKPKQKNQFAPTAAGRKKILVKQKSIGNSRGYKFFSTNITMNTIGTNLALRKRRNTDNLRKQKTVETTKLTSAKTALLSRQTRASLNVAEQTETTSETQEDDDETDGRNANKKQTGNKRDIRNIIRRRTKTVVTKITNTFRRGNKPMLRSVNKTNRADEHKRKLEAKAKSPDRKTFLRNLSFRKSTRNARESAKNSARDAKKSEKTSISKEITTKEDKKDNKKSDRKSETATDKSDNKADGKKSENDGGNGNKRNTKQNNGNQSNAKEEKICTNKMTENNKNETGTGSKSLDINEMDSKQEAAQQEEIRPNSTVTVQESQSDAVQAEPKLKRKRSIKSIINDIRAKCEDKTVSNEETNKNSLLDSTKSIDIPTNNVSELPHTSTQNTPISLPLSLTIQPLDEPLNLVISPRNKLPSENTTTLVSPPLSVASITSSESISPRRRTRKLNDCIAKLTEKLGVSFLDPTTSVLPVLSPDINRQPESMNKQSETESLVKISSSNIESSDQMANTSAATAEQAECRRRRGRKPKEISQILIVSEMNDSLLNEPLLKPFIENEDSNTDHSEPPVTELNKESAIEKVEVIESIGKPGEKEIQQIDENSVVPVLLKTTEKNDNDAIIMPGVSDNKSMVLLDESVDLFIRSSTPKVSNDAEKKSNTAEKMDEDKFTKISISDVTDPSAIISESSVIDSATKSKKLANDIGKQIKSNKPQTSLDISNVPIDTKKSPNKRSRKQLQSKTKPVIKLPIKTSIKSRAKLKATIREKGEKMEEKKTDVQANDSLTESSNKDITDVKGKVTEILSLQPFKVAPSTPKKQAKANKRGKCEVKQNQGEEMASTSSELTLNEFATKATDKKEGNSSAMSLGIHPNKEESVAIEPRKEADLPVTDVADQIDANLGKKVADKKSTRKSNDRSDKNISTKEEKKVENKINNTAEHKVDHKVYSKIDEKDDNQEYEVLISTTTVPMQITLKEIAANKREKNSKKSKDTAVPDKKSVTEEAQASTPIKAKEDKKNEKVLIELEPEPIEMPETNITKRSTKKSKVSVEKTELLEPKQNEISASEMLEETKNKQRETRKSKRSLQFNEDSPAVNDRQALKITTSPDKSSTLLDTKPKIDVVEPCLQISIPEKEVQMTFSEVLKSKARKTKTFLQTDESARTSDEHKMPKDSTFGDKEPETSALAESLETKIPFIELKAKEPERNENDLEIVQANKLTIETPITKIRKCKTPLITAGVPTALVESNVSNNLKEETITAKPKSEEEPVEDVLSDDTNVSKTKKTKSKITKPIESSCEVISPSKRSKVSAQNTTKSKALVIPDTKTKRIELHATEKSTQKVQPTKTCREPAKISRSRKTLHKSLKGFESSDDEPLSCKASKDRKAAVPKDTKSGNSNTTETKTKGKEMQLIKNASEKVLEKSIEKDDIKTKNLTKKVSKSESTTVTSDESTDDKKHFRPVAKTTLSLEKNKAKDTSDVLEKSEKKLVDTEHEESLHKAVKSKKTPTKSINLENKKSKIAEPIESSDEGSTPRKSRRVVSLAKQPSLPDLESDSKLSKTQSKEISIPATKPSISNKSKSKAAISLKSTEEELSQRKASRTSSPVKESKSLLSTRNISKSDQTIVEPQTADKTVKEIMEKVVEKASEKSTETPKSKKVSDVTKSLKSKKTESKTDTVFESSDDELLPWDPEFGFIREDVANNKEPVSELEKPEIPKIEISTPIPKVKKKRKSELAQIIADQLLESFKEVDKSRIEELKKIHDLSLSSSEELLSSSLSNTPIPKRKSKKLMNDNDKLANQQITRPTEQKSVEKSRKQKQDVGTSKSLEKREQKKIPDVEKKKLAVIMESTAKSDKTSKKDIESDLSIDERLTASVTPETSKVKTPKRANKKTLPLQKNISSETTSNAPEIIGSISAVEDQLAGPLIENSLEKKSHTKEKTVKVNENKTSAHTDLKVSELPEEIQNDVLTATSESTTKSPVFYTESLFSYRNLSLKNNSLSTILKLTDFNKSSDSSNDATNMQPLKSKNAENMITFDKLNALKFNIQAPFMPPRWDSDDKSDATTNNSTISMASDKKLSFWDRNSELVKNKKSRLFGLVKSKTKKIMNKFSRKKIKRALKASVSSSSSSSSSTSSTGSNFVLKKPLLRPSILATSINERASVENPLTKVLAPSVFSEPIRKDEVDVFDALKQNIERPVKTTAISAINARKMGSIRRKTKTVSKETIADPKSPIESDMNIAKIAIALEKSNRNEKSRDEVSKLNEGFLLDESKLAPMKLKRLATKAEKKSMIMPCTINAKPVNIDTNTSHQDDEDSSQDTMISEIVSKIRQKAECSDSDDDGCLPDVITSNLKKSVTETRLSKPPTVLELSELNVERNFSVLGSNINEKLDEQNTALASDRLYNEPDFIEDENTNTEVVDMDLEDDMSVYTTMSHDTSVTSGGGVARKKRRKKKSILLRSSKKSKHKQDESFVSPAESHYCDICNKAFRNQSSLTTHKSTITHISKLSEQEFLSTKKQEDPPAADTLKENIENKENTEQSITTTSESQQATIIKEKNLNQIGKLADIATGGLTVTTPTPHYLEPPVAVHSLSPKDAMSYINQNSFEPVSSPEQNSRYNSTPKRSPMTSSNNSRLTLSHEERLFYECCSMLKGSDRTTALSKVDSPTKPVTPKSNEQSANLTHSAQSPRSHCSPRPPGIPAINLNQFSDISSDSNPAYSCPQIPSSSKTSKIFSLDDTPRSSNRIHRDANATFFKSATEMVKARDKDAYNSPYPNSSLILRNYPDTFSDMGDSFPSSQDASESEHYSQTILERTKQTIDPAASPLLRSANLSKVDETTPTSAAIPSDSIDFRTYSNR